MKHKERRILVVLLLLEALAGAETSQGLVRASALENTIRVSGNIDVRTTALSFKVPGWIEEKLVCNGDIVARGDCVAQLDRSELEVETAIRRAELNVARSTLAELEAGSQPKANAEATAVLEMARASLAALGAGAGRDEIAMAEANVARTSAVREAMETSYRGLMQRNGGEEVPDEALVRARAALDVAEAEVAEAAAQYELVQEAARNARIATACGEMAETFARYLLVAGDARQETVEHARARVERAQANLQLAEIRLGNAALTAPSSGVVISGHVEIGEYVARGVPVITIGNLDSVRLRTHVNKINVGRLEVGQRVRITTAVYPGRVYHGRVSFISPHAESKRNGIQSKGGALKRTIPIVIDIPNPRLELVPGMPVDAEIQLRK